MLLALVREVDAGLVSSVTDREVQLTFLKCGYLCENIFR